MGNIAQIREKGKKGLYGRTGPSYKSSRMVTSKKPERPRGRPKNLTLLTRRREEILETAARLFAERGFPGTDLQVGADVLGIGKGTLYRYFPSKSALCHSAAVSF